MVLRNMNDISNTLPLGLRFSITLILACVLTVVAVIDMKTFRIPDWLSLPLIAVGLAFAFAVPGADA